MTSETSITWEEKSGRGAGVIMQTQDWRLECNAKGELLDCLKLEYEGRRENVPVGRLDR